MHPLHPIVMHCMMQMQQSYQMALPYFGCKQLKVHSLQWPPSPGQHHIVYKGLCIWLCVYGCYILNPSMLQGLLRRCCLEPV